MTSKTRPVFRREASEAEGSSASGARIEVPDYLEKVYWWAYTHPKAVWVFERQWLVNCILWGNYRRLRDAALDTLGRQLGGKTLQIACVYGDLTQKFLSRLRPGARLDVVDVAPAQVENLRKKVSGAHQLGISQQNAVSLCFDAACYDQVLMFFLLHEMPEVVRRQALAEAWRVLKPGGRLVIVDYHRPPLSNPLRYPMALVLKWLEPFALDLWRCDLATWLPEAARGRISAQQTFFGGLYQKVVISR